MNDWKIDFLPRSLRSVTFALMAGCMGSMLIAHDSGATPDSSTIPESTPSLKQSPKAPSQSGKPDVALKDPVMSAIREQLGIKQDALETTIQSPATTQLSAVEKLNQVTPPKSPALPNHNLKKNAPISRNTTAQALTAFYSRADQLPLWVSKTGVLRTTLKVMKEFGQADAHGLRPKDFQISQLGSAETASTPSQLAAFEIDMSKMALKYAAYAKGGRIDPRKLSRFQNRGANLPPPDAVLEALDNADRPAKTLVSYHPQHPQFKALRKELMAQKTLSTDPKASKKKKRIADKRRAQLLINMERWRWMPEKMQGDNNIFVWANVPELKVRIVKDGKTVFYERVIAGLPNKQSPMFSDKMEWIEFNPTWYIPNSIKVADILPSLRRKGRVMSRYHLRIDCGAHGTDFTKIDWKKVDIRKCSVIQPTGAKSVLGKLKFKFPNKHSVYMHDTLTPGLFNQKHRILSHGCIRVRNPGRMAEVLLANDKGMSAKRVKSLLARGGLHTEHLSKSIPVHITYFSTRVKKDGALAHHPDYYGHDKRLAQALLGKGHLFKGAIYRGSSRSRRKRKPRKAKPKPTVYQQVFANQ
ncbi:MAG: L,D-transpeptidase family protein [bacterium]|nr:L,D-transpeptidase family protein [bacterium]